MSLSVFPQTCNHLPVLRSLRQILSHELGKRVLRWFVDQVNGHHPLPHSPSSGAALAIVVALTIIIIIIVLVVLVIIVIFIVVAIIIIIAIIVVGVLARSSS